MRHSRLLFCLIFLGFGTLLANDRCTRHPYEDKQASIRIGNTLCKEEEIFLRERHPKVKAALEQVLGMQLANHEVPTIAFCGSGGGYRSMISSLGALQGFDIPTTRKPESTKGFVSSLVNLLLNLFNLLDPEDHDTVAAEDLGLLNLCTYCTGLSGSSWGLTGLLHSGKTPGDYLDHFSTIVQKGFFNGADAHEVALTLLRKYSYEQPISLVDVYGGVLAQRVLEGIGYENPNDITVVEQQEIVAHGKTPLPIETALIGEGTTNYEWVEFTPYEVGSPYMNSYVPTWACGRNFDGGFSQDCNPPQSLGFFLGVWGSAMTITAREFFEMYVKEHLGGILIDLRNKGSIFDERLSPAQVHNWNFNVPNVALNNLKNLELVDAGIDFNIAVPPVLHPSRHVDIIIIFDASAAEPGEELEAAEQYAKSHGLKFPSIDYSTVNKPCSIHHDTNLADAPIVIYLPLIKNITYQDGWDPTKEKFTSTFNSTYTPEQVQLLSRLAKHNVAENKDAIINVIKQWIEAKRNH